jgi:hypothetical protein
MSSCCGSRRWFILLAGVLGLAVFLSLLAAAPRRGLYSDDFTFVRVGMDVATGRHLVHSTDALGWRRIGIPLTGLTDSLVATHELFMRTATALAHLAGVLMLVGLAWRLTRSRAAAVTAGLLFAAPFPAYEAILWQSAATVVLTSWLVAGAAIHACWSACTGSRRQVWLYGAAVVMLSVIMAMTYEQSVPLLAVMPIVLLVRRDGSVSVARRLVRLAWIGAASLAVVVPVYLLAQSGHGASMATRGTLVIDHRLLTERLPQLLEQIHYCVLGPHFRWVWEQFAKGAWHRMGEAIWLALLFGLLALGAAHLMARETRRHEAVPHEGGAFAVAAGVAIFFASLAAPALVSNQIIEIRLLYMPLAGLSLAGAGVVGLAVQSTGRAWAALAWALRGLVLLVSLACVLLTMGAALMFEACGARDATCMDRFVAALPDPGPYTVVIPVDVDVSIESPHWANPWDPPLFHVFETSFSAGDALKMVYRRMEIDAAATVRYVAARYACPGPDAARIRINGRDVFLSKALFVTPRADRVVLRYPVHARRPDGTTFELPLPEAARFAAQGTPVEPLTLDVQEPEKR